MRYLRLSVVIFLPFTSKENKAAHFSPMTGEDVLGEVFSSKFHSHSGFDIDWWFGFRKFQMDDAG